MNYSVREIDGGPKLVHIPMPGTRSASIAVFMGVGSRYENDRVAGVSHMVEHMLFKGTERRPGPGEVSEAVERVGGLQNASTDKELTVYWIKVAAEHLPLAADVLSDMLRESLLRARDLRTERSVILEELHMAADDPQDWVHVLADEVMWPLQPLGREIAGTEESVSALTTRQVRTHLAAYYGRNNAVVSIAGGVDLVDAETLVTRCFTGWETVPAPPYSPAVATDEVETRTQDRPTEQVNVCVVYPGIARRHPDRWILDVTLTILGGGTSSRLFQALRERRGLAYEAQAYSSHYSDAGSMMVYLGTDPAKLDTALDIVTREVRRLARRGITADELDRAKSYFAGRMWLGMEDSNSVASWFGAQAMLHHDVVTPADAVDAVARVTLDDVQRVARTYLRADLARVAAVGPGASHGLLERVRNT